MNSLENFTVIIPCINFKDVKKSLINIRKIYKTVKIIVCLNQKVNKTKDKNLNFIYTNLKGIGAKRNLAVKNAKTKYLAFIDSDAYPATEWLECNLKLLKNKKIGIIAGPHIDPIKQNFGEKIIGQVKKSFIITMNPGLQKKSDKKNKFVSFMPSCNWIMSKKNFLDFGCMDANMRRNEDWDFVYNRMAKTDFKILYNPKSTIYHENYNYWSLTSLVNFFNQFDAKIFRSERVDTHGGSLRIYVKKDKKVKVENCVKKMLKEEEVFGIKKYKTYKEFGEKVYKIRENVIKNIKNLKKNNKIIIGYGAPAKATTALNFFGISKEIEFIVEDNKLKHNKFIPGVKIQIKNKNEINNKNNTLLVLAWNFYQDIKKNNSNLSNNFINIKDLESNNF